ncbi:MAG: SMI1/KNR4 family protein [Burkholderiales bacterium]|nr:SMI1/KNR4 family protein [Burkholderiales bacterium]
MVDLGYEASSLLSPPPAERIRDFAKWLSNYWERPVTLPSAYVEHISRFHGGAPGLSCFTTSSGRIRSIGRFLNFLEEGDLTPPFKPTWRQWSGEPDVRLDYRVAGFFDYEFWCVRMEGFTLLPIAGLDTAGQNCRDMDEMSLLCLDYSAEGEPPVVTWDSPFDPLDYVADSFSSFLPMLRNCDTFKLRPAENF